MLGTPIRSDYRQRLLTISLARGAQATAAIEGNTLSESEVEAVQAGKKLPPSKEYLEGADLSRFIAYAAAGLRDGLQAVFGMIRESLFAIAWENYVHGEIGGLKAKDVRDGTTRRLRSLAWAIPADRSVPSNEIDSLSPGVAKGYSVKAKPTLSRDLAPASTRRIR